MKESHFELPKSQMMGDHSYYEKENQSNKQRLESFDTAEWSNFSPEKTVTWEFVLQGCADSTALPL